MKPHIRLARVDGCQSHGVWICYKPQPGMRRAPDLNSESWMGVGLSPRHAYTEWRRLNA
jgi:hypothetical protein